MCALSGCDSIWRIDHESTALCGDSEDCTEYLRADYSIECGTSRHTGYKVAAWFAFLAYSIVAPAVIAFLLYRGRHKKTKSPTSALMAGFSFYSKQFKPEFYFWETIDLYRKLLMTSMVVFIADGTSLQITFGSRLLFAFINVNLQLLTDMDDSEA